MLDIQLQQLDAPEALVVKLNGQLGVLEVGALDAKLREARTRAARRVIVDLTDLTFIASLGIATLMNYQKDVQAFGGKVGYVVNPVIRLTFDRAHLRSFCELYDDLDAARAALSGVK